MANLINWNSTLNNDQARQLIAACIGYARDGKYAGFAIHTDESRENFSSTKLASGKNTGDLDVTPGLGIFSPLERTTIMTFVAKPQNSPGNREPLYPDYADIFFLRQKHLFNIQEAVEQQYTQKLFTGEIKTQPDIYFVDFVNPILFLARPNPGNETHLLVLQRTVTQKENSGSLQASLNSIDKIPIGYNPSIGASPDNILSAYKTHLEVAEALRQTGRYMALAGAVKTPKMLLEQTDLENQMPQVQKLNLKKWYAR